MAAKETSMKSASLPPVRVTPELRKTAEQVLEEGETFLAFIELSIREMIEKRQNQKEFMGKGLASRERARKSGGYVDASLVCEELHGMLKKAKGQSL